MENSEGMKKKVVVCKNHSYLVVFKHRKVFPSDNRFLTTYLWSITEACTIFFFWGGGLTFILFDHSLSVKYR